VLYEAEVKLANEHNIKKDTNDKDEYTIDELWCIDYLRRKDEVDKNPERSTDEIGAAIKAGEIPDNVREAAREYQYYKLEVRDNRMANWILAGHRLKPSSDEKDRQIRWYHQSNPQMTNKEMYELIRTAAFIEKMKEES
jgi:hypothetical protein